VRVWLTQPSKTASTLHAISGFLSGSNEEAQRLQPPEDYTHSHPGFSPPPPPRPLRHAVEVESCSSCGLCSPLAARQPISFPQVRMVEGPQCHRVAHAHRKALVGRAFKAVSPNQRFTEGRSAFTS